MYEIIHFIYFFRVLLTCVCVVASSFIGTDDIDNKIYYLRIEDHSTDGGSIKLETARKTLKCITCDMYALTQFFTENSSLVETIDFSQSRITKLNNWSRRVSKFENLRVLNLSHNQIDDIRITYNYFLQNSVKLTTLDLSYNCIQIVPSTGGINRYTMLAYLDLSHNEIFSLESDCFKSLPQLQTLKLNNNLIPSLNASVFADLENLLHFDLSYNAIAAIDDRSLNLRDLELLDISYNSLKVFDLNTSLFQNNKPTEFFLDGNALTALDVGHVSERFPNLKIIGISGNAWKCHYLLSLVERLNASGIEINVKQPAKRGIYVSSSVCGVGCDVGDLQTETSKIICWTVGISISIIVIIICVCLKILQAVNLFDR